MNRLLTYLACPYSHPDPLVRVRRFDAANQATVALIKEYGWNVFSPITHSHPLHLRGLAGDWAFWERMDTEYLECSTRIVVLRIPGWSQSVGVKAELKIANRLGLEKCSMTPVSPTGIFTMKWDL